MDVRESLLVDRKPFGMTQASMCAGRVSRDGTLTVYAIETGYVCRMFPPGTWSEARGVGVTGAVLYTLQPSDALRVGAA